MQEYSGLLAELLRRSAISGISFKPTIANNELIVEITEQEFLDATTKDLDPRVKQYISLKFTEGKMVIRVKLF